MKNIDLYTNFKNSFKQLKDFCEKEDFKGWDPYDGLNSSLFQKLPYFNKNRFIRLAWIQTFKRLPVNFRKLVGVDKAHNPKGLALFLIGYCNMYEQSPKKEYLNYIEKLTQLILEKQTKGYSGACWGYNFDWQARAFFQPKHTPTVVATSFVAEALIASYRITNSVQVLDTLKSIEKFITIDLNKTYDENKNFTLSYSPLDNTQVFNAGLLGAKTLCLLYEFIKDEELLILSKKIVQYVCNKQQENGAWAYGTLPFHQWIDNFHTGYNLECIFAYQKVSEDLSFQNHLILGTNYYLETFFTEEGMSKYYNNQLYPIDIHAPAQLIITLSKLNLLHQHKDLVDRVLKWTINHMQSSEGYFYYQKRKNISSKIPYMRWAQSWMFYAFSFYFLDISQSEFHDF
ncbi:delta-aminolevulinic acid dehydratase [Mesonia aestuariivivens]|uniref:Delta-aminolevulinic acid dehydratase n=1 Tax=Mesonia aestuariivivens TaxID=2796128 RepID=A0ABS6W1A5_9FLAO|nr:delta-aminolevulinic acid dehydratase [Mesonia aestuariivivens]MBW2961519.1 delta-aminolevulinic acid dehydratase [Mesonia aestuariivivens]